MGAARPFTLAPLRVGEQTRAVDGSTSPVRIEVGEPGAVGSAPNGSGTGAGPLLVGLVAVVIGVAALLIFSLRPEAGESADGTQRQEPEPTTSEVPGTDVDFAVNDEGQIVVRPVRGFPNRGVGVEIVRGPNGYVAFGGSSDEPVAGQVGPTPLFRSLSGERWDDVGTAVVEDSARPTDDSLLGGYRGLFQTSSGLGLFHTTGDGRVTGISAASSAEGDFWSIDGASLAVPGMQGLFGDIDGEPVVGLLRENEVQTAIFEQAGLNADVPSICGVSFAFLTPSQIRILGCDGSSGVVTRDQVAVGESFDEVVGCLTPLFFLGNFSGIEISFLNDPTGEYSSVRPLAGFPARLDDGRLVGIARPFGEVPAPCEGFADVLPMSTSETLLIWDGPGQAIEVDIGLPLGEVIPSSQGLRPWAVGDSVVIVGEEAVWRIALDGTAQEIITLDSGDFRTSIAEIDDEIVLLRIVDGQLRRWSISETSVELFEAELDQDITAQVMLYQDDEIAIFRDRREPHIIRWPDDR